MTTSEKKEITIDEILKDVNIQNEICKDLLKDKKRNERNLLLLFVFIVAVLIAFFCYIDFSNKAFLSQYNLGTDTDVETTATHSNNTTSNVNIGK